MTRIFSLAAALAGASVLAGAAFAQGAVTARPADPLTEGRVLELSFGIFTPTNTLQDTLTTPNNGGPQVQSTGLLDFGTGGRVALTYGQDWGDGARLIVSLAGAKAAGDTTIRIGSLSETFPGSYDDGLNLPANWTVDMEVETRTTMLRIGKEWAAGDGWRISAGLQGGTASQDLTGLLRAAEGPFTREGEPWRSLTTRSDNRMLGVFGGVSHYKALGDRLGLRLSGTFGVMHNRFDYRYVNLLLPSDFPPSGQDISASASGTAFSTKVSARLEQGLSDNGVLVMELGYEGLQGIGSGVDTFLDPDGTNASAKVDSDRIGAGYVSLGYALRF